jgi:hypothetical protein
MKRVSVALTLGLSIAATQGCMSESADTMDVGSADQALCETLTYSKVMAALLVAMTRETGELHPTKYLSVQANKFGSGKDGVIVNGTGTAACAARGYGDCTAMQTLLVLQTPGLNPGIDPAVLNVEDYRSNLVAKLKDQLNYENSRAQNGQCLPPAHLLTEIGESLATCGKYYEFSMAGAGGGSPPAFEVTREAESYNAINRNNSQHNWTLSGGNMTIGPNYEYTWTSNIPTSSPNLSYSIAFPAAGTYKVWVRASGTSGYNDSAYVGINNSTNGTLLDFPENGSMGWTSMDISVPGAGTHNVQIFAREDGLNVDKLVVNQSSTPPGGSGGVTCNTPADLQIRIDRFQVNSAGYVGFQATATSMKIDPDPIVDPTPGSGSGSGSAACGPVPSSGSDRVTMPYNAEYEGDCCWNNYVQKTYKRYQTRYLMCMN